MDVSTLLVRALHEVFGENDPERRRAAIDEIFHEHAAFYEHKTGIYRGRNEIDRIAGMFRATHPDFRYRLIGDPEVIGDGGRVRWVSGRPGEPPVDAGTDFIISRDGRIAAVYLFFDSYPEGRLMKSASELLEAYLNNVATPRVSASQFAEDGVLELPWVKAYARGPAEVEKLLVGMLAKVPDFRFKNLTYFIQTPDKVAAEYQVEALVLATRKIYRQTYAGVLVAENGKIKLLHETLDTLAASQAFSKD